MSSEKSTVPMPSSSPPAEVKCVHRVLDIPFIKAFTSTLDETLSKHATTPYGAAKGMTTSIIEITNPVQARLSPVIVRVDTFANATLDVFQSQCPWVFTTKPEDVTQYIHGKRQDTSQYVRERSASFGKAIDHGCTPFVDVVEFVVKKTNPEGKTTTPTESQYQYQRAMSLSKDFTHNVYGASTEQWKQLEDQYEVLRTASVKVQALANSSVDMSSEMIAELSRLRQVCLKYASELPQRTSDECVQVYSCFNDALGSLIGDVSAVAKENIPVREKVNRLATLIEEKAGPLINRMVSWTKSKNEQVQGNGNAH